MTDLIEKGKMHVAGGCGRIKDHIVERGEGSWIHTVCSKLWAVNILTVDPSE